MRDIYKSVKKYNPGKRRKELIVFDDMIADVTSNKRLHPVVTDSFIMDKKLNIYLLFITQSLFLAPKDVRIHIIHPFMINILKKSKRFNKLLMVTLLILTPTILRLHIMIQKMYCKNIPF